LPFFFNFQVDLLLLLLLLFCATAARANNILNPPSTHSYKSKRDDRQTDRQFLYLSCLFELCNRPSGELPSRAEYRYRPPSIRPSVHPLTISHPIPPLSLSIGLVEYSCRYQSTIWKASASRNRISTKYHSFTSSSSSSSSTSSTSVPALGNPIIKYIHHVIYIIPVYTVQRTACMYACLPTPFLVNLSSLVPYIFFFYLAAARAYKCM